MTQWNFGDSFDVYASTNDFLANGYWENPVNGGGFNLGVMTGGNVGRFAGSNCMMMASSVCSVNKNSGQNNNVHHVACGFQQTGAYTSNGTSLYFSFYDGATAQCTIGFDINGTFHFYNGGPGGALLGTWTPSPALLQNVWYGLEFEVVIHNTAGSFRVRKNGNGVDDYALTGVNTRASANNYANMMQWGGAGSGTFFQRIDDIFWRSDTGSVGWMGDIRSYTRYAASDVSTQFNRVPTTVAGQISYSPSWNNPYPANTIYFSPFQMVAGGLLTALTNIYASPTTGHTKMAIYDDANGAPGNLLAQSAEVVNPNGAAGNTTTTTYPVASGPQLIMNRTYWLATWADASQNYTGNAVGSWSVASAYTGSFPASGAGAAATSYFGGNAGVVITTSNASCVGEPMEDGLTSYVYDANLNDADFYSLAPLGFTPIVIIATTVRGYARKSDIGGRSASMQLKSGATVVATPSTALPNASWQQVWRTDAVDPNTGASWTAGAVDALTFGPKVSG